MSTFLEDVGSNVSNVIGEGIKLGGDYLRGRLAVRNSKELYDYQTDYSKLFQKMVAAGINPAAAAQGLSGVSPSMVSMSAVGQTDLPAFQQTALETERNPSIIARNEAEAARSSNEAQESTTRSWLNIQNLFWNPKRWQSEIDLAKSHIKVNESNSIYLNELSESLIQKRPYEIAQLQSGLQVAYAQVTELLSRSKLNNSMSKYYKWQSFRPYWESIGLQHGWDITQPFWRNLTNLAFTNPKKALNVIQMSSKYLSTLDSYAQQRFGKNYKRNARNALLLHYANNRLGEHNSKKAMRIFYKTGALKNFISSFIPFLGSSGSVPINSFGSYDPSFSSSRFGDFSISDSGLGFATPGSFSSNGLYYVNQSLPSMFHFWYGGNKKPNGKRK